MRFVADHERSPLWLTHCREHVSKCESEIPFEMDQYHFDKSEFYFSKFVSASGGWRRNPHQNHLYPLQQKHHPSSHQGAKEENQTL